MYLVDEPIAINWEISLSTIDTTIAQDYFDIIVIAPVGATTYYTNPKTGWVVPVFTSYV